MVLREKDAQRIQICLPRRLRSVAKSYVRFKHNITPKVDREPYDEPILFWLVGVQTRAFFRRSGKGNDEPTLNFPIQLGSKNIHQEQLCPNWGQSGCGYDFPTLLVQAFSFLHSCSDLGCNFQTQKMKMELTWFCAKYSLTSHTLCSTIFVCIKLFKD